MSYRLGVISASLILATCVVQDRAVASTREISAEVQNVLAYKGKGGYPPTQRRLIAQSFEKYWASFLARIPRLSPSEHAWIEQEVKSGSSERLFAIWPRVEYSKYQLVQHATGCVDIFRKLQSHIGSHPAEAYLWVKSLNCHRDADGLARLLRRLDLMQERVDQSFYIAMMSVWVSETIDGILEDILN